MGIHKDARLMKIVDPRPHIVVYNTYPCKSADYLSAFSS